MNKSEEERRELGCGFPFEEDDWGHLLGKATVG